MGNCTGIPANPDIAGVGVRVSIYIQSFITLFYPSFALALSRLTALNWEPERVASVHAARYALLATGFGLLIASVVQAKAFQLTAYHALILLNLSWIIALTAWSSAFFAIYRPLFAKVFSFEDIVTAENPPIRTSAPFDVLSPMILWLRLFAAPRIHNLVTVYVRENKSRGTFKFTRTGLSCAAHLSFTSAIGLWLFSDVARFDTTSPDCTLGTVYSMLGHRVKLSSGRLRTFWLAIYGIGAVPVFNIAFLNVVTMLLPLLVWLPRFFYRIMARKSDRKSLTIYSVNVGELIVTLSFNCFIIASTERMVVYNFVQPGEAAWTFGQTLALLLVIPGVWACFQEVQMTRQRLKERRQTVSLPNKGPPCTSQECITCGRLYVSGTRHPRRFSV